MRWAVTPPAMFVRRHDIKTLLCTRAWCGYHAIRTCHGISSHGTTMKVTCSRQSLAVSVRFFCRCEKRGVSPPLPLDDTDIVVVVVVVVCTRR